MASFVLIPGAGADPRVYDATIAALARLGHDGFAPPLPLDDPTAAPSDHARAVLAGLPAALSEAVVVGQSLGAFAAPLVAERLHRARLVLLAPMIPRPGETAGEWWQASGHSDAIAPTLARLGPMAEWGQEAIQEVFLHDVDPGVAQATASLAGVPGPGMFAEPWPSEAWPQVPTSVLAPRDDRLFPLAFQQRLARERLGVAVDEMPGGHLPMLARPQELAVRLVELALRTPASRPA